METGTKSLPDNIEMMEIGPDGDKEEHFVRELKNMKHLRSTAPAPSFRFLLAESRLLLLIGVVFLVTGVVLSGLSIDAVRDHSIQLDTIRFSSLAARTSASFQGTAKSVMEGIAVVAGGICSRTNLTNNQFALATSHLEKDHLSLRAIAWVARVPHASRGDVEDVARTVTNDSSVFMRDFLGAPAANRSEYFPIMFVQPLVSNKPAIMLQLSSSPARETLMNVSRDLGKSVATAPINLVQTGSAGVVVFTPVYDNEILPATVEQRRSRLIGYVQPIFEFQALLQGILDTGVTPDDVVVSLYDQNMLVGIARGSSEQGSWTRVSVTDPPIPTGVYVRIDKISVGQREYVLHINSLPDFQQPPNSSALRVISIVISCLVCLLVWVFAYMRAIRLFTLQDTNTALRAAALAQSVAEKASQSKSAFLAYVFHECRVPFNSVMIGLETLLHDRTIGKDQHETLTLMRQSAQQTIGIMNDVLDMKKIESGHFKLNWHHFAPSSLLDSVKFLFQPTCTSNKIRLEVESLIDASLAVSDFRILGDLYRLRQCYGNLVSNSIKFTPPGGTITLQVVLSRIPREEMVVFPTSLGSFDDKGHQRARLICRVVDTGAGMSPEGRAKLFRPFEQVHELGKVPRGTGLGLMFTRKLMELHGGSASCTKSVVGEGSTFELQMPCLIRPVVDCSPTSMTSRKLTALTTRSHDSAHSWEDSEQEEDLEDIKVQLGAVVEEDQHRQCATPTNTIPPRDSLSPQSSKTSSTPSHRRKRSTSKRDCLTKWLQGKHCLVVDDSLSSCKMMGKMFQQLGVTSEARHDGQAAVDYVTARLQEDNNTLPWDFITMDMSMPIMDGPECTRCLRAMGVTAPIIALTGNAFSSDQDIFMKSGATTILIKPFQRNKFLDKMATLKLPGLVLPDE